MSDREPNDFYATHPSAIPPLLNILQLPKGSLIWENSCGEGHLCKPLIEAGHHVIATDLMNRGFGIGGIDFLQPSWFDQNTYNAIIMNPPYKHAEAFIRKSLMICTTVCAFLKLTFLESDTRREFFKQYPPEIVAVFCSRVPCAMNGRFEDYKSHPVCYAWFIWRNNNQNPPQILWI